MSGRSLPTPSNAPLHTPGCWCWPAAACLPTEREGDEGCCSSSLLTAGRPLPVWCGSIEVGVSQARPVAAPEIVRVDPTNTSGTWWLDRSIDQHASSQAGERRVSSSASSWVVRSVGASPETGQRRPSPRRLALPPSIDRPTHPANPIDRARIPTHGRFGMGRL